MHSFPPNQRRCSLVQRLGSTRIELLLVAVLVVAPGTFKAANAQENLDKPNREIFVPYEDLNILLEGQPKRVFMSRAQYDDLRARSRFAAAQPAPLGAAILSADYQGFIEEGRMRLVGSLEVEVLTDGLHALPLKLAGVGLQRATFGGLPASLGRDGDDQPVLFVEGRGTKRTLVLEMVVPLASSAAQQALDFHVPAPPSSRFRVTVPGNVEAKSGADVVSRTVDREANVTRFEILPQQGRVQLAMSLNNKMLQHQRVVVARSVVIDELTEAYERLHATVSMRILHGAADSFRFEIPNGFEITDVASPLLAKFDIAGNDDRRILNVTLREPTSDDVVLNISAVKTPDSLRDWKAPQLLPLDTAAHAAVVGVLLDGRLSVDSIEAAGLIPINNSDLNNALPASVFEAVPGSPPVRAVAAFYSPQSDYELSAEFEKPPAQLKASTNFVLAVKEESLDARGQFRLRPEKERLFAFQFTMPNGWQLAEVTDGLGNQLPFQASPASDTTTNVHVKLPSGLAPDQWSDVLIRATSTPTGWLGVWSSQSVNFPVMMIQGVTENTGTIAIQAVDDMRVQATTIEQLTPLDDSDKGKYGLANVPTDLAYRFDAQPFVATLQVERIAPLITARTYAFLRIEPEGLAAHYEIVYDVQRARTRELLLRLPANTPDTLSIRGLDGAQVKEFTSQMVDDERLWTAALAEKRDGSIRLAVDFTSRLEEQEPKNYPLPLIKADGVQYQTATVAVEGHGELDVEVKTDARKVDVGQLAGAEYRVGRRLLGAYGFLGEPDAVRVDVYRRPGYGLPPAIVQRAELVTLVSTSGLSQTGARYQLRTKAPFLEFQLPSADSELWSVMLNRQSAKPQRDGKSLLISLPGAGQTLHDLQIVYETPIASVGAFGKIDTPAPRLFLRDQDGLQGPEVPVANLQWRLALPPAYRVVGEDGSVVSDHLTTRQLAATRVLRALRTSRRLIAPEAARRARVAGETVDGQRMMFEQLPRDSAGGATEEALDVSGLLDAPQANSMPMHAPAAALPPLSQPEPTQPALPPGRSPFVTSIVPGSDDTPPAGKDSLQRDYADYWALQGVGSLKIDMEEQQTGERVTFHSLGEDPRLSVSLVDGRRLRSLAWSVTGLVGLIGVLLTTSRARTRMRYVVFILVASTALPLITGWIHELGDTCDMAFFAACWLIPYYVLTGFVGWLFRPRTSRLRAAATAIVLVALAPAASGRSQDIDEALLQLLLKPPEPIKLPADAVIIPYDADQGEQSIKAAPRLLVPYASYVEMWNLAYPDKKIQTGGLPADYSLAGAEFETTLAGEEHLTIRGHIHFEVFTDAAVNIPLPLSGGVLVEARIDGEPARLAIVSPAANASPTESAPAQVNSPNQMRQPEAAPESTMVLQVEGKGRKRLDLTMRLPLQRQGGWRIAKGRLPTAPATSLVMLAPQERTEIRMSGVMDRQSYETTRANERIETALAGDGSLQLQWRPKVAEAQVDQSLTVESTALLDVQEDGLRITWRLGLEFRRSRRSAFSLKAPGDYIVERVVGGNVAGWESRPEGAGQRIEIALLNDVADQESLTIVLSRRGAIGRDEMAEFAAPVIDILDSALHRGVLQIRRSPLLELRTVNIAGLAQTDVSSTLAEELTAAGGYEESPLGIRPYQAYSFATVPFSLELAAEPVAARSFARVETVLGIAQREVSLESRINLNVRQRPVYQAQVSLPAALDIHSVRGPGAYEWSLTADGDRRLLTVFLGEGQEAPFSIYLEGRLPRRAADAEVALPQLRVLNVERQDGAIAVQVDPAYKASPTNLVNCEKVLLQNLYGWLSEEQRAVTRVALEYASPDYSGAIRVDPETPKVTVMTVTNVRVTERTIEETILLDFAVANAGIQEVAFLLPDRLATARIDAPLLRQKTTTAAADGPTGYQRVRLEFQDDVMGQLVVTVKHDRLLSDEMQTAPIPIVETGETRSRFVVLESAGRDEVVIDQSNQLEPLSRQQTQRRLLDSILGSGLTQAFVVRSDADAPRLSYQTRRRITVETAGARIGKAETVLAVDDYGAFRGQVEFRINNDTEQFLVIRLPTDSKLWTASVAGEPVKPTEAPAANDPQLVRIPLVKTAEGDPDYGVVLKYGGRVQLPGGLQPVEFPIIHTVNVNVELSQVRLMLPPTQQWFYFGGTMRRVADEGEYRARDLVHLTRQIRIAQQALSSANPYTRLRASNNLKQLDSAVSSYQQNYRRYSGNEFVEEQLDMNAGANVQAQAQRQIAESEDDKSAEPDNRARLEELWKNQRIGRSKNVVSELNSNFADEAARIQEGAQTGKSRFNSKWLVQGRLQAESPKLVESDQQAKARVSLLRSDGPAKPSKAGGKIGRTGEHEGVTRGEAKAPVFQDFLAEKQPGGAPADLENDQERYKRQLQQQQTAQLPEASESAGEGPAFGGGREAITALPQTIDVADSTAAHEEHPTGLASLDVDLTLTSNGAEYYFIAPRGEVVITARSISAATYDRVLKLAGLVAILLGCMACQNFARSFARAARGR